MAANLQIAWTIGSGLVKAGMEIFDLLEGKDELSREDLQDIIARENEAQEQKIAKLQALLDAADEE